MSWQVAAASRIGSIHVRSHLPLQDAALTWSGPGGAVVAVADGHGHHLHFRSDVGAALAVRCGVEAVRAALPGCTDLDAARALLPALAARVVTSWTAAVHDHIAEVPFDPGFDVGDPLRPYGTTLAIVAALGPVLVALQVGDGDVVVVRSDGQALRPLPDDPRHDGVHTTSMCQPDVLDVVRHVALDVFHEGVALAFACTDGFGTSRVDADWWQQTGTALLDLSRTEGMPQMAERLPGWLEEPAEIGGDDTTLGLLVSQP